MAKKKRARVGSQQTRGRRPRYRTVYVAVCDLPDKRDTFSMCVCVCVLIRPVTAYRVNGFCTAVVTRSR